LSPIRSGVVQYSPTPGLTIQKCVPLGPALHGWVDGHTFLTGRMLQLPIDAYLPEIIAAARTARALVIVAEPGAGKTTRVPPALLSGGVLDGAHPALVMLQPRRVAARAAAARIAAEQRWTIGNEVGWHVRFDKTVGPRTRLRVLTEGILTRQVIDDPFLEGIGGVILDEFHERSIHTDLTIALLREVRQTVRPDLVLIVMSATLDAAPVAKFLGDCPIINVPGRTYPVEVAHAPMPSADPLPQRLAGALRDELERGDGDVLAFLPGVFEIDRSAAEIAGMADRHRLKVVPLHGSLPPDQQMRALEPSENQKVILATNIAETSLTIEGVKTVIDSGLARVAGFDAERGLDRLDLKRISKASAIQRAGRAGRTGPGRCVRLYTAREFHSMSDFELPEIWRARCCRCTRGARPTCAASAGMTRRRKRRWRRPSGCWRCWGRWMRRPTDASPRSVSRWYRCRCIRGWRGCWLRRRRMSVSTTALRWPRC
jgi:ATP-dependent helicase HrpB